MSETYVFEGKTTNEAIDNGLKELKRKKDEVNIKVLNEDKKSFFSILTPRVVKVEMTLKENVKSQTRERIRKENIKIDDNERNKAEQIIKEFVKELLEKMNLENIEYDIKTENEYIVISSNSQEVSYLIGYRGETLNAIQVLFNAVLRSKMRTNMKVTVDICGYKEKRKKTLEDLAIKVSKTVMKTGKSVTLEPMIAYERKIIHAILQQNDKIETYSVGEEPHRKIVISLKK